MNCNSATSHSHSTGPWNKVVSLMLWWVSLEASLPFSKYMLPGATLCKCSVALRCNNDTASLVSLLFFPNLFFKNIPPPPFFHPRYGLRRNHIVVIPLESCAYVYSSQHVPCSYSHAYLLSLTCHSVLGNTLVAVLLAFLGTNHHLYITVTYFQTTRSLFVQQKEDVSALSQGY